MKSKALSLVLAILFVLTVLPISASASNGNEDSMVIYVEDTYARIGAEVDVNVMIKNNKGVAGATLVLSYDTSLELISATSGEAFSQFNFTTPGKFVSPCGFLWDSLNEVSNEDGVILTLKFRPAENAVFKDSYHISISAAPNDIYDVNMNNIPFVISSGSIIYIGSVPGDANSDGSIDGKDVTSIRRYLAGGYGISINPSAADVNDDGIVNGKDITLIRRYIVGGYDVELLESSQLCPHHTTFHQGYPATTNSAGMTDYWTCDICGKIFSDALGGNEITLDDTIIPVIHYELPTNGAPAGYESIDFGGRTFNFVTTSDWSDGVGRWNTEREIAVESRTGGTIIDTAVYDRNRVMETLYNCKINAVEGGATTLIANDVKSGTNEYDFGSMQYVQFMASKNGYYTNMYDLDLDMNLPGWNKNYFDQVTVRDSNGVDKLYSFDADFNLSGYRAAWVLFCNLDLYNQNFTESIFDIVERGEWTVDKMIEMVSAVAQDNGDQTWTGGEDTFGLMTNIHNVYGMITSTGIRIVDVDAATHSFSVSSERIASQNNVAALDKLISLYALDGVYVGSYALAEREFQAGRTLFMGEVLDVLETMSDNENLNVAVLPEPLYQAQENPVYKTFVNNKQSVYIVSANACGKNKEIVSDFINLFVYHSNEIVYPAFRQAYGSIYCSDVRAAKMLDYIFSNRQYDLGYYKGAAMAQIGEFINIGKNQLSRAAKSFENSYNGTINTLVSDMTLSATNDQPVGTTESTSFATTTLPLYARFDFGTESYAAQNNLTAHQFLMDVLEYDSSNLYIDVKEDSWKIWVISDWNEEKQNNAYSIKFDSLITFDYDFDDSGLFPGWGTWSKFPYSDQYVGERWVGRHQYMKIRLINNSTNNMIGLWWSQSNTPGYFTTMRCSNLYLQGAAGSNICTPTKEYRTYIYDIALLNALASNRFGWGSYTVVDSNGNSVDQGSWCTTATFSQFTQAAANPANLGNIGANNWCGAAAELEGIQFFLFGAVDDVNYANTDSRKNAKFGANVEVDYILFGSSLDQLQAYQSNIEKAALENN